MPRRHVTLDQFVQAVRMAECMGVSRNHISLIIRKERQDSAVSEATAIGEALDVSSSLSV